MMPSSTSSQGPCLPLELISSPVIVLGRLGFEIKRRAIEELEVAALKRWGMERALVEAIEAAAASGEQAAVATVVSTFGSAPRQPFAKYVATEKGRYVGSVSGGCVESDVAERAQKVFAGEPAN